MDVLLAGEMAPEELARWRVQLAHAAPQVRWLDARQAQASPSTVRAAVVAQPAPGLLQGLPALGLIQSLWAGVDRLLQDPTLPAGVPLARMVDPAMTAAMVETALWATLALHRDFFGYQQQQREGRWRLRAQRRADEVPVLVLGFGAMGRATARALAARGYPTSAWRLHGTSAPEAGVAVQAGPAAMARLLAQARIVINLLPLTPATRGLLDRRLFDALPRGAAIVNLARGAHLVDEDLLAALDAGQLRHAVLDVFHHEPLPAGHPFWTHPAVTLLPHAAAQTDPRTAARVVADNLQALQEGRPIAHVVDRERGY